MDFGLASSLIINILVGAYFFWLYPRSVRKNFPTGPTPRGFALLLKVLPTAGLVLIVASVLYGILAVAGAFGS